MLAEDGLFSAELVMVENNWACVELLTTFPRGMQPEVCKRMKIQIAELEDVNPSGSRSLGQTEAESRERAIVGIEHQSMGHVCMTKAPNTLMGLDVDMDSPDNPRSLFSTGNFPTPGQNLSNWTSSAAGTQLVECMRTCAAEYEKCWRKAAAIDLKHFNIAEGAWKEGDNAPDVEGEDEFEVDELGGPGSQDVAQQKPKV
ncbi:hypothetical protein FRC10_011982 [Ceratobasidium sp. 414]|nr:hypothetical protein FRC10_011982 [Ceratobasidium sp. 414]